MTKTFKVGSMFAGVGGICLGFQQANIDNKKYKLIWANEMDPYACITYKNNFNHNLLEGDIRYILEPKLVCDMKKKHIYEGMHKEILKEKIDVLLGGFPCQAFSIAGERKGFKDDRGNLFLSIINLINELQKKFGDDGVNGINGKPRILFLENVKNLKSHDKGRTYNVIKSQLEKQGYIIKEHVLNTMDYSYLPQNRERIYIIGFLYKEDADKFDLFSKIDDLKLEMSEKQRINNIKNIIDYKIKYNDKYKQYYYTKEKYPKYFLSEEEYYSIPEEERKVERINLEEQITDMYQFYQVRRGMYVRKNKKGVCPTLTANMGTGGHNVPLIKVNDGIRKLTPSEAFGLQGFPIGKGYVLPEKYNGKKYADSHLYKQAGNAVSVPIVKMLADEILKIL